MNELERSKKVNEAFGAMIGIDLLSFIVFWVVRTYGHSLTVAFAALIVGLIAGAAYYIYQSYKLRSKD